MVVTASAPARAAFASALLVTFIELAVLLVAIAPWKHVAGLRPDSVLAENMERLARLRAGAKRFQPA